MTLTELRVELEYHTDDPLMREVKRNIEELEAQLAEAQSKGDKWHKECAELAEDCLALRDENDALQSRLAEIENEKDAVMCRDDTIKELSAQLAAVVMGKV